MKANTPELMKFKRLKRRLGETRRGTIGLLEAMWIEVARNCPEGDIGRFTDEEIAIMVDWEGDPSALVSALIDCGWLDKCQKYRLVIHDWADHCPTYVKGGLAKRQKSPIAGATTEVQAIGATSEVQAECCSGATSEVASTKPSQAKPNQAKPNQAREEEPPSLSVHLQDAEFSKSWKRWSEHLSAEGKPLNAISADEQLMRLSGFSATEATAIVRFSIERGAKNLITNGDHKQKQSSKANQNSGGKIAW